jgi:hypothetical protein
MSVTRHFHPQSKVSTHIRRAKRASILRFRSHRLAIPRVVLHSTRPSTGTRASSGLLYFVSDLKLHQLLPLIAQEISYHHPLNVQHLLC